MSFHRSIDHSFTEIETRRNAREGMLTFGMKYLDDAMIGITKNDLILVGAASGGGKTQFCCNVARANVSLGKRVHYIALEAEHLEIEKRIKYQIFANKFFSDPNRPRDIYVSYQNWAMGDFVVSLQKYEAAAAQEFMKNYPTLFVMYKAGKFDVSDLIIKVLECSTETDLIIVDHVHYMDYDGDSENKSLKNIAITARDLALEQGVPIILVSHMRKKDRNSFELAPGQEDFHGSSDLYKAATRGITLGPGRVYSDGSMETFVRIVKNRLDGSPCRYIANCRYNQNQGIYEKIYHLGNSYQNRDKGFEQLAAELYPRWATYSAAEISGGSDHAHGESVPPKPSRGSRGFSVSKSPPQGKPVGGASIPPSQNPRVYKPGSENEID
jgi:KaiC/GvpD/RAD55 family RecA-like ATPase